ncbi:MAG: hypothetical protein KGL48_00235 [Sphingomonadales bacterium]|nr:hypothetical protein [Sphingomonadales bacterium]MDE2569544.1 hypothetical protein [Sphingomonadales bacterium]
MKRLLIAGLAASAAMATPAFAQTATTGTVTLDGHVGSKCTFGGATTISDSKDFGELSLADGTLATGLSASFDHELVCNGATVKVELTSVPQFAISPAPTAVTGYTSAIDYTAAITLDSADSSTATATVITDDAGGSTPSANTSDRLATGGNNVHILVNNFHTAAGAVLTSGAYQAVINYTITPMS